MTDSEVSAEFIGTRRGKIFVLARHPRKFDGRCTLVVPPFAEEMNKSRRMLSILGHGLAAQGRALIVPDFYGTGDSEGDFAETNCEGWYDDLQTTERWSHTKGWSVDSLLGIRLGCLFAICYALRCQASFAQTVLWQPQLDGGRALEQFLRLRMAASLTTGKSHTAAQTQAQFSAGASVEIAGYELSAVAASQIRATQLPSGVVSNIASKLGKVSWLEVVRSIDGSLPALSAQAFQQLGACGASPQLTTVPGEPFWAGSEIVCNDALIRHTTTIICGSVA